MKVNKNYLFKVISEVLLEAEEDHNKIMSMIQDGDEESINQAAELYEMGAFDLSEEELEDIMKFFKANEFLGAIIKFKLADKNISVDVRDLSRYGNIKLDQRLWDDSFELTGDIAAAQQALADMGMEMAVVGDFLYVGEKARKLANFREGIKTHLGVAIPNDVDIRLDVWGGRGARMEFPSGLSITWEAIEDEYAEDSDEEDYFMEIMMPNKIGYMVKHTSGQGITIVKQDESSGDFEEEVIASGVSIEGMKRKIHELTNIDLDAMSALDSNALLESDDESSSDKNFEKLMDIVDGGGGTQALEMYDYFDLSEEQIKTLYTKILHSTIKSNLEDLPEIIEMRPEVFSEEDMQKPLDWATKKIFKSKMQSPELLLKAIGFDFHNEFTQVYGVTPPRDKEFSIQPEGIDWGNGDDMFLAVPYKGGIVIYGFWFEGTNENNPSDPYIQMKNSSGEKGWIEYDSLHGGLKFETEDTEADVEDVPATIQKFMDVTANEGKRKLNKSYLMETIAEVMSEIGENFGGTPEGGMDQESQNILRELLQLNEDLDESQYYYDAQDLDTDQAEQAIDLQQSLGGEDDRDRSAQVDKYVSLKVKKVLKDAIKTETMNAITMLVAEAADHINLWSDSNNDEEHVSRTVNNLTDLYERALRKPLEAVEAFDGSQESLNKWLDAMESAENNLKAAEPTDPAIKVMETIIPKYFLIGDYYVTGAGKDWHGVEHTDRKNVKPRTAVKEAEEFFRPAIMKTIMGIQSRESGVDVGKMLGLNENEEGLESEEKEHLIQLLSGDEEMIRQGLALADMLVPDLMDKVNEMDENDQLPMVFLEIFRSEIQKEVQKYYSGGGANWPEAEDIVNSIVADDSTIWTTDRVPRKNDDYKGKTMIQVISELQFGDRRFNGQHLFVAALDILDERIEQIDPFLAVHFYADAGFDIIDVLEGAFNDRSKLEPYIEKWKASELVKLIK